MTVASFYSLKSEKTLKKEIDNYMKDFEYFKDEAESDDVETALRELGENDYTEEEIRLVRIKFLSEMGN